MELRLWTAVGLLLVITVGAVVGVTLIALVVPGGSGGSAPAPERGADAQAPSVDAPEPGLLTRVFRYAVAFGFGGFVGLFLGILVGQKAARSQSSEPIPDPVDDYGYGDGGDRYAESEPSFEHDTGRRDGEPQRENGVDGTDETRTSANAADLSWESNR